MKKFPEKVPLPQSFYEARKERQEHLLRSMKWGVCLRSIIIIGEVAGATFFGSSALFMDALSSALDVGSTLLLALFIRIAARPPDANHPFGHGRFEPLAGLQLGFLLVAVGIIMTFQQTWVLQTPTKGIMSQWAWLVPLGAVVLLEICYFVAMQAAKKHHSPALEADAYHYRIDSLTSLFAVIALFFAAFFPEMSFTIDRIGAISIAILMIILGVFAVTGNIKQLLDATPDPQFFEKVKQAAKSVNGVKDTEKTQILFYGPDAHVNIDIEVEPELTVEEAHQISQQVRASIQAAWPAVRDVIVHIEPYYPFDH